MGQARDINQMGTSKPHYVSDVIDLVARIAKRLRELRNCRSQHVRPELDMEIPLNALPGSMHSDNVLTRANTMLRSAGLKKLGMKNRLFAVVAVAAGLGSVAMVPANVAAQSGPAVKMSKTGICNPRGGGYYNQNKAYIRYSSMEPCIRAGGRPPKR